MYERKGYRLRSDGHIFLPVTDTGIVWKVLTYFLSFSFTGIPFILILKTSDRLCHLEK